MDIDSQVKQTMNAQVDDFLQKLLELADFKPGDRQEKGAFQSQVRIAREQALAKQT